MWFHLYIVRRFTCWSNFENVCSDLSAYVKFGMGSCCECKHFANLNRIKWEKYLTNVNKIGSFEKYLKQTDLYPNSHTCFVSKNNEECSCCSNNFGGNIAHALPIHYVFIFTKKPNKYLEKINCAHDEFIQNW